MSVTGPTSQPTRMPDPASDPPLPSVRADLAARIEPLRQRLALALADDPEGVISRDDAAELVEWAFKAISTSTYPVYAMYEARAVIAAAEGIVGRDPRAVQILRKFDQHAWDVEGRRRSELSPRAALALRPAPSAPQGDPRFAITTSHILGQALTNDPHAMISEDDARDLVDSALNAIKGAASAPYTVYRRQKAIVAAAKAVARGGLTLRAYEGHALSILTAFDRAGQQAAKARLEQLRGGPVRYHTLADWQAAPVELRNEILTSYTIGEDHPEIAVSSPRPLATLEGADRLFADRMVSAFRGQAGDLSSADVEPPETAAAVGQPEWSITLYKVASGEIIGGNAHVMISGGATQDDSSPASSYYDNWDEARVAGVQPADVSWQADATVDFDGRVVEARDLEWSGW